VPHCRAGSLCRSQALHRKFLDVEIQLTTERGRAMELEQLVAHLRDEKEKATTAPCRFPKP
jgi:hypothetical protein